MTMNINKKIKQRIFWGIAVIALGFVMWALCFTGRIQSREIYIIGITYILSGAIKTFRNINLMSKPKRLQQLNIAENDERNIMLWTKARSMALSIYIIIASFIFIGLFMIPGMELAAMTMVYSVCIITFIYWICYIIVEHKYQ